MGSHVVKGEFEILQIITKNTLYGWNIELFTVCLLEWLRLFGMLSPYAEYFSSGVTVTALTVILAFTLAGLAVRFYLPTDVYCTA